MSYLSPIVTGVVNQALTCFAECAWAARQTGNSKGKYRWRAGQGRGAEQVRLGRARARGFANSSCLHRRVGVHGSERAACALLDACIISK
jgi:hypothetical protein